MRRNGRLAAVSAVLLLLAACAGPGGEAGAPRGGRELVVLAAASLTEAFGEIGEAFEETHPGATVTFSFGPSDGLAAQIREGAPADVFASASPAWMDDVEENGPGILHRADFARNLLVVITPPDDPGGVSALEDLARPGLRLVLAAPGVPAGGYARQVLENAGIADRALANLVSNEEDVKGVVQKVLLGEADAGIVYRTDVTPAVRDQLRTVEIPHEVNVVAVYPIGVVASSDHPALARAFVDEVLGPGQGILRRYGFLPPP